MRFKDKQFFSKFEETQIFLACYLKICAPGKLLILIWLLFHISDMYINGINFYNFGI